MEYLKFPSQKQEAHSWKLESPPIVFGVFASPAGHLQMNITSLILIKGITYDL